MSKATRKINIDWLSRLRLEEGWLSFTMLLLAFMIVIWSIQGAGWVDGISILPTAGLLGFLLGFALAKTRFVPGLLAHSFMLSVGMVLVGILIFPYTDQRYDEWFYKMGSTVQRVVKWLGNAISGRASEDALVGLVGLGLLAWSLGYSASWLVFRRHRVWSAISLLGAVLVVNLAYNPPNAVTSFLIFLISSLLLVTRFSVFQNEERWRRLRLYFRPGKVWWSLGVGSGVTLALVAVAFATPSNSEFAPLQNLFNQISGPWQSVQTSFNSLFSSPGDGKEHRIDRLPSNYNTFAKSFTLGGPIKLSNDPILKVKGYDPSYLQAAVMDNYDGRGWMATYQDAANPSDIVFPQLGLGPDQRLPSSPYSGRVENQLEITPLIPNLNTLFTGGDAISTSRSSLLAFHWEKVVIRANLSEIQPQEVGKNPDGRARVVLVDTNTGKPIPPDLLPLVRMLRDSAGVQMPSDLRSLQINMVKNGDNWNVSWTARIESNLAPRLARGSATLSSDGTFRAEVGNSVFRLPSPEDLAGLKLAVGAAPDTSGRLQLQYSNKNDESQTLDLKANEVQHPNDTTYNYTLTFNTTSAGSGGGSVTKQEFEQTAQGKEIAAEVERLSNGPFGAKVDYSLVNGKPNFFYYEGYQPNYDDLLAVTASQPPAAGETYRTDGLRYKLDEQTLRQAGIAQTTAASSGSSRLTGPVGTLAPGQGRRGGFGQQAPATVPYPDWVTERYLQLPDSLPSRVKDLAKTLTSSKSNAYDKAKAVEEYLRTFPYNLDVPPVPQGRDFVDYFLFDGKQGYCTYYASAFVVMMRSVGVPARLVTGLIGGEFDQSSSSYIIRGTASHAWPQVYFQGVGWVNFEPTPAYNTINRPADPSQVQPLPTPTADTSATQAPGTPDPGKTLKDPEQDGHTQDSNLAGSTNSADNQKNAQFPLWLIFSLGIIAVVAAGYQGNRFWRKAQYNLPDTSPQAVYSRMVSSARKAGLPNRTHMTPYEYSEFLTSVLPKAAPQISRFTTVYVHDRYSRHAESDGAVQVAVKPEAEAEQFQISSFIASNNQYKAAQAVRDQWEEFMNALLEYRKEKTIGKVTPRWLRRRH